MDLEAFAARVRQALEAVRQCLVAIEESAQTDDDPRLLELSRAYAVLVVPLRDYLTGVQLGRPLPRTLARRLSDLSSVLIDFEEDIERLGLQPDLQELDGLVREAETAA